MHFNTEALLQSLAFLNSFASDEVRSESFARISEGSKTIFRIESNIPFGTVRAESEDGNEYYEYVSSSGTFKFHADGEEHAESNRSFPVNPPLLGLLNPVQLPIWGGESSFYQPIGADLISSSELHVRFGYRSEPEAYGKLIIDLSDSLVRSLEMNKIIYTRIVNS